ncbi:MAG TPA: SDR family NAD(P)-dependent oxidoreductase [Phenylobacterium sp.]|nr:SDR family NAD(P)-dependent oxidoreductase [Phenylobacterium sp.]HQP20870.1 SDR family NAD(P)-dependent oxidoreductase [Phenylobacterium sp.]
MGRLSGKVAVITGGVSGIGRATVERFEAEGAKVVVGDIDDAAGAALANSYPGTVAFQHCDVMVEAQIEALMAFAVERFGALDILFNNAGAGGSYNTLAEMTGEAWDYSQNLLLRSVALGMRYALPHMKARGGGAIVNTASIAGTQAGAGPIAYSVAKAGVIHLTRVAAAEVARDGIRVNAICPGLILTNIFTPASMTTPDMASAIKAGMAQTAPDSQPIAKPGLPEDIANAALFFASEESAFVTGVHMLVDGGMFVGPRHSWDPEMRAERQKMAEARRAAFEAAQKGQG